MLKFANVNRSSISMQIELLHQSARYCACITLIICLWSHVVQVMLYPIIGFCKTNFTAQPGPAWNRYMVFPHFPPHKSQQIINHTRRWLLLRKQWSMMHMAVCSMLHHIMLILWRMASVLCNNLFIILLWASINCVTYFDSIKEDMASTTVCRN